MKLSWIGIICGVGFALSMGAGELHAQPTPGIGASRPPTTSPYLNLLRNQNSGNSQYLDYYGIVRPEVQTYSSLQNLSGEINQNRQDLGDIANNGMGPSGTGHPTQFLNLGGYFLSRGTGAAAGGKK